MNDLNFKFESGDLKDAQNHLEGIQGLIDQVQEKVQRIGLISKNIKSVEDRVKDVGNSQVDKVGQQVFDAF